MKEGAAPQIVPGRAVEAETRRDAVGELRDASAVARGVRIAGVDELGEGEDQVLGVLVLVGELLEGDERLHPREKLVG